MASKTLNYLKISEVLAQRGLTDLALADALSVSKQAVSKWKLGRDFPRPVLLLRLSEFLGLSFGELVVPELPVPVVAFRKKANAKTTDDHVLRAQRIGRLLRPLLPYLNLKSRDLVRIAPVPTEEAAIDEVALRRRKAMGLSAEAVVEVSDLVAALADNGAMLVPVQWGARGRHENAMHIELPEAQVAFVYLNLDCKFVDIKFWIAHELAHSLTPELSGSEEGEDFADRFAAAFLVPPSVAEAIYDEASLLTGADCLASVNAHADRLCVNALTIFKRVNAYALAHGKHELAFQEVDLHKASAIARSKTLASHLWGDAPPPVDQYIDDMARHFHTDIFAGFARLIRDDKGNVGYLQQVLDVPEADAELLFEALAR